MKNKGNFLKTPGILLITLLCAYTISCDNAEGKYNEAKKINTIESYQQYIAEFPEGQFTNMAKAKIDSIAYEAVTRENTESGYLDFIQKYPGSKHKNDVINKASYLRYVKVSQENSVEGYQRFISDYPQSEFINEAKMKIEDIQNGRRYWSDNDFVERVKIVNEQDFTELWEYKFMIIDGGNEITFAPDKRNGSIPIIDMERTDMGPINIAHLVIILYQEGMKPIGGKGIGEIFIWNRSLLVYFFDKGDSKSIQDELYQLHRIKSEKHHENNRQASFSTLCTVAEI